MKRVFLCCAAIALASTTCLAQAAPAKASAAPAPAVAATPAAAAPEAPKSGFRADILKSLDDLEKKSVSLAEAVPEEKYTWRPGEGVRSIGEVYMHMASGNYAYANAAGNKAPADLDVRGFEKLATDKAKTVATLKQSFVHVRQTVLQTSDADLDKAVKMFGRDSTIRNVLFIMQVHQSEHLGQSIAYARSVGVVPPWTEERQAAQKKAAAEKK
ncbi:MAG: hypothetical protein JWO20_1469 [Candidatus Angelobacter sp.]|jgi:uncharacterized damage-inducible protein DinB|nr:hypothetical protein [Candidatus Angelobacter sp.]